MITIIILVITYLICVYGSYMDTKISYSKDGRWKHLYPGILDFLMMIIPMLNFISTMDYFTGSCYARKNEISVYDFDWSDNEE